MLNRLIAPHFLVCISTDICAWTVDGQIRAGVPEVVVQLAKYPYIDAYSAFMDNAKQVKTELDAILRSNSISTLYIAVSIPRPPPFPFNLLERRGYAEDD